MVGAIHSTKGTQGGLSHFNSLIAQVSPGSHPPLPSAQDGRQYGSRVDS